MGSERDVDDATLRQLLRALSHDIRNPLAAIVTNLEFAKRLLVRLELDPDLTEAVDDSAAACDVLQRIVTNLDVLAKHDQLTGSMNESIVAPICQEIVGRCENRARQSGLVLVLEGDTCEARLVIDRTLFSLALENLISNAIQYGPSGSTIRIELVEEPGQLRVSVHDEGGTVPTQLRPLATSPAGNTPKGRQPETRYGRGVGLLAAKLAAAGSGAELRLGSEGGHSRMDIVVPLVCGT